MNSNGSAPINNREIGYSLTPAGPPGGAGANAINNGVRQDGAPLIYEESQSGQRLNPTTPDLRNYQVCLVLFNVETLI